MVQTEEADWYDTPLYYDIIFDEGTEDEAAFVEAVAGAYGGMTPGAGLKILEPACGSGRLVVELAGRGHEVAGFDLNPAMLGRARERLAAAGQEARLWQDRLEAFSLPDRRRYDIAVCLVSTFKYIDTEDSAVSHLEHVAGALRKGGLYVLGFHLSDYASTRKQRERWVGQREGITVVCNTQTWPADKASRTERIRTRLKITRGGRSRVQETPWIFRSYDQKQVAALLRKVPAFECVACHDFHYDLERAYSLPQSHFDLVLVLRKK